MAGKTILVVEDNTIQREGLAVVLQKEGYTVLAAANAHEAMDVLRGDPVPDLILLDMLISPPEADGWHFLGWRKQVPALAAVPVIITTSLPVASREWASSLGAVGLIRKPFEASPLLAEVRRCLG
jgi:CheY-like chemotaxis protein